MKKQIQFLYILAVLSLMIAAGAKAQDAVTTDGSSMGSDTDIETMAPVSDEDTSSKSSSGAVPQIYSIRQGDTMWDICKIVLDNPWYWPKLWSLNQYILNPNLIYPGNRLAFSPGTETSFPKMEVVGADEDNFSQSEEVAETETTRTNVEKVSRDSSYIIEESKLRKGESLGIRLRPIVFVSKKGMDVLGNVSNSPEPKMNLVFGDKVYLTFNRKLDVKVGDRFQVIEKVKTVYDPDRETKKIGSLVKKKAVVTVNHVIEDKRWRKRVVEAVISDGDDPIQRENEIVAYEPGVKTVTPHFTDKEIFGKIVEADSEQVLISNNDYVFLNIGTKDGVQPGLQLYAVRRGDGLEEFVNDGLPDYAVARILIVEAYNSTATGYVTTLDRPLAVGDRVKSKVE